MADREGVIPRNVADLVDGPGYAKTELHVLTGDEPDRFLHAVAGERLEALFVLAVTSGLRQGELLALRWANVDLDDGALEVVGSLSGQRRADRQVVTPKTGKGRRVSLAAPAVTALREHRRQQTELRLAVGAEWLDRGLVFCDETGHFGDYLRPANLNRALNRILECGGLPHIGFTISATPPRRACSAGASTRRSPARCSGTAASTSRSTATATSPLPCSATPCASHGATSRRLREAARCREGPRGGRLAARPAGGQPPAVSPPHEARDGHHRGSVGQRREAGYPRFHMEASADSREQRP